MIGSLLVGDRDAELLDSSTLRAVSLYALRRRMPLPVFIIVLAIALVFAGFACACLSDHPLQALERLTVLPPTTPSPLIDVWALAAFLSLLVVASRTDSSASTQARLQRFRF